MAGRISAHCHLGDIKNAGQKVKKATLITAAYFMPASPVTENVALQGAVSGGRYAVEVVLRCIHFLKSLQPLKIFTFSTHAHIQVHTIHTIN